MNGKGYFVVHEWMVTELGLKGTELLVYAIIYGFTQIEEQRFYGTRRYLADFTGASLRAIQDALNALTERSYLIKEVSTIPCGGVQCVSYKANLHPQCKNCTSAEIAHNNTIESIGIKEGSMLGSASKGTLVRKRNVANNSSTAFDLFWKVYPRHVAKQNAVKAFAKLNPNDDLLSIILKDIEARKKTDDWLKNGGQFIPHPATYLNGKRWEDEMPKNTPSFNSKPKENEPNWGDD